MANRARVTADEMNIIMPPVNDDDTSIPGGHTDAFAQATSATAGPSMTDVIAAAGSGTSPFIQDAALIERYSQGVVEPQNIAYTEQRNNEMRGIGESIAALQSSGVQQYADPQYKEQLKNIAAKAASLGAPDTVVRVDNQRIILSDDVKKIPAAFDTNQKREESLALLEAMIGYDRVIEVISCARSAGITFVSLPLLWLSQMLAVESKKNELFDDMPRDLPYSEEIDGQLTHDVPRSIAALFSGETARNIQMLAKLHRVPMLYVLRFLVDRVCKQRRDIVTPKVGAGTKYNDLVPQIQVHAA